MANRYKFPDPKDRSQNDPGTFAKSQKVLDLYNRAHDGEDDMQNVTKKVQEWFSEEAKNQGWDTADFYGNACLLVKDFTK